MPYLRDFSLLFWYNESIKIKAVFPMMTQNADKKREQIQMFCMDDLVPVSYTHLDVYKRQVFMSPRFSVP